MVATLLDQPTARDAALAAAEPVAGRWQTAARCAAADRQFARAGVETLLAAAAGLRSTGLPDLAAAAEEYADRYPARGRSPADDLLDAWAGNGEAGTPAPRPALLEGNLQ
jgi:glutamate--cysteine ligase